MVSEIYAIKLKMQSGEKRFRLGLRAGEEAHLLCKLQAVLRRPEFSSYRECLVYSNKGRLLYRLSPKFLFAPLSLSIIGAGYVGLVSGVGLCHRGLRVVCVDVDREKVESINRGIPPIHEKGLGEMLSSLPKQYFSATTQLEEAVLSTDVTMLAVGTPSTETGEQNLEYLKSACEGLGKALSRKQGHMIIVKSTVPPGTTLNLVKPLVASFAKHSNFSVAMMPEFLREGLALQDFLNPDRIIVGVENEEDFKRIRLMHHQFNSPFVKTDPTSAEMIKLVSNAFLSTKISFANEIGNLCKRLGVDVYGVMDGVGMDKRIGRSFLNAGRGFGGSCLPKDLKALLSLGTRLRQPMPLLSAVMEVNEKQPLKLVELAERRLGMLRGKRVCVLGLAFKPGTDDVRDSPAIQVIELLLKKGAQVTGYDPVAEPNMRKLYPQIEYAPSVREAIEGSDIVIGVTDWPEFSNPGLFEGKLFIDGMRILNKKSGGNYEGICW